MKRPATARVLLALTTIAAILGGCLPRQAEACMAPYRTPEFLAATSPLIIVGRVEKVEESPAPKDNDGRERGDRPCKAVVRVLRILKGTCDTPQVTVLSGPILSCSPFGEAHYSFKVGETEIFIFPSAPEAEGYRLHYGRSVRSLTDTSLVERRIREARDYQEGFLKRARARSPEAYRAAEALCVTLAELSKAWPEARPEPGPPDGPAADIPEAGPAQEAPDAILPEIPELEPEAPDEAVPGVPEAEPEQEAPDVAVPDIPEIDPPAKLSEAGTALLAKLEGVSAETIQIALAMNWQNSDPKAWHTRDVWHEALDEWSRKHADAVRELERRFVRRTLEEAGVEKAFIDGFLASRKDTKWVDPPAFPPGVSYDLDKMTPQDLTTDFILRFHCYERGFMYPNYAMYGFHKLGTLDVKRVREIVPALFGSDDEYLRWVAGWAVRGIPGTDFVELVLRAMFDGQPDAHEWLIDNENPTETEHRLDALTQKGGDSPRFWALLRHVKCFEPVCLRRAVEALAKSEGRLRELPEDEGADQRAYVMALGDALRDYLDAAMVARQKPDTPGKAADVYRKWFDAHPAPAKKTAD